MSICQTATASALLSPLDRRKVELSTSVAAALDSLPFEGHHSLHSRALSDTTQDDSNASPPWARAVPRNRQESKSTKTSATSTSMSATSTAPTATFTLPKPFDDGLGSNFTQSSCPEFITKFLDDPALIACHPISLLLQSSTAFFDDTKFLNTTTYVLEASCSASFANCSTIMSSYASQLVSSSNCGADYGDGNPVVTEALDGLLAYEPVYRATCLKDGTAADNYCFADAVTNTSSPTSSYVYYLPVGVEIPADSTPTCNGCLKTTMREFATYASSSTQPLSKTYNAAAREINRYCGAGFADSNVTVVTSGGVPALEGGSSWLAGLVVLATLFM